MKVTKIKTPKEEGLMIMGKEGHIFLRIEEAKELYEILDNWVTKAWLNAIGDFIWENYLKC